MKQRKYITVNGWVQGVGFRYFVKYTATSLGLTGWVRNRDDGAVELEAQGDENALETLLKKLHEGNRYSQVEWVAERNIPLEETEYGFLIDD